MKREKLQLTEGISKEGAIKSIKRVIEKIENLRKTANKNTHLANILFFINCEKEDFYKIRNNIITELKRQLPFVPANSIIGQPPADDSFILAEIELIIETDSIINISYHPVNYDIFYTRIETDTHIEYDYHGITVDDQANTFEKKVLKSFDMLDQSLNGEGMGMNNIVRQWNYVEDIVGFSSPDCGSKQNYQVLNNIRHEYYSKYTFSKGYPAATGIGMSMGAFILDCMAIKEKKDIQITPVKNPIQVSAYDYSEKVLIGSKTEKSFPRLSPKFERAKYFNVNNEYLLMISGTAAIHNELSLAIGDVAKQTEITLDNIDRLIKSASDNISSKDKRVKDVSYPYLRVYIKDAADYQAVKDVCEKYNNQMDPVYLIADVCREELLVEIEGVISIKVE